MPPTGMEFNDTVGRVLSSFPGGAEGNVNMEILGKSALKRFVCGVWNRDPRVTFKQGYYIVKPASKMNLSKSSTQYIGGCLKIEIKSACTLQPGRNMEKHSQWRRCEAGDKLLA